MAKRDKRPRHNKAGGHKHDDRDEYKEYLERQRKSDNELRRRRLRDEARSFKENGSSSMRWRYADASETDDLDDGVDDFALDMPDDPSVRRPAPSKPRTKPKHPIVAKR